ncbi:MAG: molybdenum cofactor biosynthesis protein MoeB, partial [Candidatus Omnitrophica bacterium]|nr:molybdenum cofactor biosynthesis protein MoeB [Candidatus Omnitrophota bacterium]
LQAMEAIKIVLGVGDLLLGRMLLFDALRMQFRQVKFRANPDSLNITEFTDYDAFCNIGRGNESAKASEGIEEISASELKKLIDSGSDFDLVDVREDYEYKIANIPNAKLIPLGTLPQRYIELNSARETVVHCHHGGRSAKAIEFLKTKGFTKLKNLAGGIDSWSEEVDDSVARY